MTSSVVDWLPVFRIRPCTEVILNSLSFLRAQGDLRLHAYVVMEDHVHLVGSSPRLAHVMKRFLSYTARHIIHYLAEARSEYLPIFRLHCHDRRRAHRHRMWRPGFHPQAIYSQQTLAQKTDYIINNPVRKGLVSDPADWPYSSLAYLNGNQDLPAVDPIRM